MQIVDSVGHWVLKKRIRQIEHFKANPEDVQQKSLAYLLNTARNTEYGKKFHFGTIKTIQEFQDQVPLTSYDDLLPYINRIVQGEQNILWPSLIKCFAKSSGTTGDKSKLVPVSRESLLHCHYQGGRDMLALYLQNYPSAGIFSGKNLSIGGSQENKIINKNGEIFIGNISAIVMKNLPFWAQYSRTPGMEIILMEKWEEKIKLMAAETITKNVTSMAGSPMWILLLLQHIFKETKANHIHEIWPNLEVFFHGSVSFSPYRPLFEQMDKEKKLHYLEIYNATEGFFGLQDQKEDTSLLLMLNYNIFYEFIPMEDVNKENPRILPLSDVEVNKYYTMVISTNSGLWRYNIGDTIKFTEVRPYRFIISGRTKHCINIFGEDLFVYHAEKALTAACEKTGAIIENYTAAPRFYDTRTKGYHEWIIEFVRKPDNLEKFTTILDGELCSLNDDYKSKRRNGSAIEKPVVHEVASGTFYGWLKKNNKLGGQHKIPRLSNNREFLEDLLKGEPFVPHS